MMYQSLLYYASFVLGLLLAVLCSVRVGKKRGLSARDAGLYTAAGFLSGVLGAALMAQAYNAVLRAVAGPGAFSPSTVSLYGGLLLIPLLMLLPVRRMRADYGTVMDTCAAGVYVLLGTAKLGCFAYGCCYGAPCEWGPVNRFTGERAFPVQLLETAISYAIAALLYRYATNSLSDKKVGTAYPLGLLLYGAARFCVQFLRAHEAAAEADLVWFMDFWQVVSCVAVLYGAVWFAALTGRNRTKNAGSVGA
ncbi:MAG: prolipoprotein diacylglyceryl transferase [Clostridia bacterium]|nr:prolipoprotein diacylglyceryl transferase [Clostridia bacterium]